jgi:hypothetical protein
MIVIIKKNVVLHMELMNSEKILILLVIRPKCVKAFKIILFAILELDVLIDIISSK